MTPPPSRSHLYGQPYRGPSLEEVASPDAVDRVIEALYGVAGAELRRPVVAHVTAQWLAPDGERRTLAINEHTPRSAWDRFVLDLSRAAAGAVVTTGATLRAEPELRHGLASAPPVRAALEAWRRRSGLEDLPLFVVLTSGRDLDLEHPLFDGPTAIFTGREGQARLGAGAAARGVEIMSVAEPTPRAAIEWLRDKEVGRISIEAGPSTARRLYEPPVVVDELLLSTFLGDELPELARGPVLLLPGGLEEALPATSPPRVIDEPSGPWAFQRRSRDPIRH